MRASPSAFDAVGLGANRVRDEPGSVADEIFGPDPAGHDIDFVANEARPMGMDYAIANGFGFGGVNASALFRRWTDESASRRTGGERDRRSTRRLPLPR